MTEGLFGDLHIINLTYYMHQKDKIIYLETV